MEQVGGGGVKGPGTTIQFSKGYGSKRARCQKIDHSRPLVQLQFAILVEISHFLSEKYKILEFS